MKKHALLLFSIIVFFDLSSNGQNRFHPWALGISYNVSNMEGLFNQKFLKVRNYSGGIKLQISRYISPSFSARLEGTYGSIYYPQVSNYPNRVRGVFNAQNFFEISYLFEYKFNNNYIFKEDAYVQPYVFLGYGTNNMNKDWNTFFPWGGGLKIKCTKWMAVNLETCYKVNIDNSYSYLQHNAGLIFSLGKALPKTKSDQTRSKKVADDLKDLVIDKEIDSDRDGVVDADDECPFAAGVPALSGCPDGDGDGVADSKDLCPNEKGSVELQGCMPKILDSDQDGVFDNVDQCPTVKGTVTNFGCPEKLEEKIAVAKPSSDFNTSNTIELFFPVSISVLSNTQKSELDSIAMRILAMSYNKISISGYTSNTGNDKNNINLSMGRALQIMNYLTSKGIKQSKINTYGYGPYNPKYDNSIPTESIKNQRVEIIIE